MNPRARKIIIPLAIGVVAVSISVLIVLSPTGPRTPADLQEEPAAAQSPESEQRSPTTENGRTSSPPADADSTGPAQEPDDEQVEQVEPDDAARAAPAFNNLRAVAPYGGFDADESPLPIGSRDWREAQFLIEFAPFGAGINRITLSDVWETAGARREADSIKERIIAGEAQLADMPLNEQYVIQKARLFLTKNLAGVSRTFEIPSLVARGISITSASGTSQVVVYGNVWSQSPQDPGTFITEIRDAEDRPVLRLTRRFVIGSDSYDITIEQRIENLTDEPLTIEWLQYGQSDLDMDRARYMDRRRYRIGHLIDPTGRLVGADPSFFWERSEVVEMGDANEGSAGLEEVLWPNDKSIEEGYRLSWFAAENRYFAVAIHPVVRDNGAHSLTDVVDRLVPFHGNLPSKESNQDAEAFDNVVFELRSPPHEVAAGATLALDFAVYAGPLDPDILEEREPYRSLNMEHLILYQISSYCAICTFQWLAHLLLWFLSLVHAVTFDWGVAIIGLVVVVRILLHPITKKSQISIQRFSKALQILKPEMDKLQQKYKDDPKRLQQEQIRLWREHNISPFSALGCLPMFLQMPIWVALYAMLYFAWELRQEPAFWGFFQLFWDWPFLGDLSAADHFLWEFAAPIQIFGWWNVTGLNVLPILMGLLFFVQQKYMQPPTTQTMSPEQQQMQKMMKIIFPLMFPILMYSVPSGLTLYILTSSIWGILESRYIRRHINEMDLEASIKKPRQPKKKKKKKPRDPQARLYQQMMERARQKRQPPPKRFKKRK